MGFETLNWYGKKEVEICILRQEIERLRVENERRPKLVMQTVNFEFKWARTCRPKHQKNQVKDKQRVNLTLVYSQHLKLNQRLS